MIRLEVLRQSTFFTYRLEKEERDEQKRSIQTVDNLHLHTGDDEIG